MDVGVALAILIRLFVLRRTLNACARVVSVVAVGDVPAVIETKRLLAVVAEALSSRVRRGTPVISRPATLTALTTVTAAVTATSLPLLSPGEKQRPSVATHVQRGTVDAEDVLGQEAAVGHVRLVVHKLLGG